MKSGGAVTTWVVAYISATVLTLATSRDLTPQWDAVYIEECSVGKYYWKEADPTEFYACVEPTRGVNPLLPDYVINAIKMRCSPGSYMCSRYNDRQFEPCACQRSRRRPRLRRLNNNKRVSSRGRLRAAAKRGPPGPPGPVIRDHRRRTTAARSRRRRLQAVWDGTFDVSTRPPAARQRGNRTVAAAGRLRKYSKQLTAATTRSDPSLPADGCPNLYRRHVNSHMFQGVLKPLTSLVACQRACLEERNCLGVDWNKLSSPSTADSQRCYFVYPESTRYGVQPASASCCDHYRRTYCLSTAIPHSDGGGNTTTATPSTQRRPYDTSTGPRQPGYVQSRTGDFRNVVDNFHDSKTGDIPDTGCPFTFKKFAGRSHPFGKNVTYGSINNTPEKCKHWCLVRAYCIGVDFSVSTSTCYFLREINTALLVAAPTVNHYEKTRCAPPLKCWSTPVTAIGDSDDARVTNIRTPSIDCHGICYVRQTIANTNVIERGCDTSKTGEDSLGCSVDGTAHSNFRSVTCYCDTARCNGLSVEALVSQMLYLPLDGDTRDHSGTGRHGQVASGQRTPSFTCLDKSVNCSALFTAGQCITVPSLAMTPFTSTEVHAGALAQVPKASFVVHFKRVPSGPPTKQGVFGNSLESGRPTWAVYADNLTDTSTAGVITDRSLLPTVDDFKYSMAPDNRWHQHVLTYNSKNAPLPTLQYFVDGTEMVGNSRLESGMISVRDQPVAVGCVQGLDFVGFIDEVRIFSMNLDKRDIDALLAMRDANFW